MKIRTIMLFFLCGIVVLSCFGENKKLINERDRLESYCSLRDTFYYGNGQIRNIREYDSIGELDGIQYNFFESGTIERKVTYLHGKQCCDNYHYYPNGKLDFYSAYNLYDSVFFLLDCDTMGQIERKMGTVISQDYLINGGSSKLILDSGYQFILFYANPEILTFSIDELSLRNNQNKSVHHINYKIDSLNSMILFDHKFNKDGDYVIKCRGSLVNNSGTRIFKDKLSIPLKVLRNEK